MEKVEGLNFSEINIHRRNSTPLSANACKSRGGTGGREGGWYIVQEGTNIKKKTGIWRNFCYQNMKNRD